MEGLGIRVWVLGFTGAGSAWIRKLTGRFPYRLMMRMKNGGAENDGVGSEHDDRHGDECDDSR